MVVTEQPDRPNEPELLYLVPAYCGSSWSVLRALSPPQPVVMGQQMQALWGWL